MNHNLNSTVNCTNITFNLYVNQVKGINKLQMWAEIGNTLQTYSPCSH